MHLTSLVGISRWLLNHPCQHDISSPLVLHVIAYNIPTELNGTCTLQCLVQAAALELQLFYPPHHSASYLVTNINYDMPKGTCQQCTIL